MNMDMDMDMPSATTAASANPTGGMMHGGMDHEMDMGGTCKISVRKLSSNHKCAVTRANPPS